MAEENNNQNQSNSAEEEDLKAMRKGIIARILVFIRRILTIDEVIDVENTTAGIKRDIDFRGPNVWILIFSILIASIGLNVNSTAVVIGAMLISPLMGPILGVGLSVGTNDTETLNRSLRSFLTMVIISLLTSTFYFLVSPLDDAVPELLARTRPTLLDVFVAFFGGAAGIVAGARKEKTNVIPGVAIATALMPPLCTAGYGLASGELYYFFGALYLFLINSIFISIATFLGVRYLKFPLVEFVDPVREKRAKRYIIGLVMLIVLPSAWIFWQVVQESIWYREANTFIEEEIHYEENVISNKVLTYGDSTQTIMIFMDGGKTIPDEVINAWQADLIAKGMKRTTLKIIQSGADMEEYSRMMERYKSETFKELYQYNQEALANKDKQIEFLEQELFKMYQDTIPFRNIVREMQVQYEGLSKIAYARSYESNFEKIDTINLFLVEWSTPISNDEIRAVEAKMQKWLKVRLNLDSVRVQAYESQFISP